MAPQSLNAPPSLADEKDGVFVTYGPTLNSHVQTVLTRIFGQVISLEFSRIDARRNQVIK